MTATLRLPAALLLAAGVFLALTGCGGGKPAPDGKDKKDDPRPAVGTPSGDPGPKPPAGTPAQPAKLDVNSGLGKEAFDFLQAVREGKARADQLSTPFAKAVGLPVVFDSDKPKGYSASSAEDWLKRVGASTGFSPPLTATQVGDAALFRGVLVGKPGNYSLRMVKEGGAWKVDWLSASTVEVKKPLPGGGPGDAVLREFAAAAVVEAVCDQDAMPAAQRAAVVAAGLTPALRAEWAPPFGSDTAAGYDYSPSKLGFKVGDLGGKAESVAYTPQGDGTYLAEVTRAGGGKAAYAVKLAAGQPLVERFAPQ